MHVYYRLSDNNRRGKAPSYFTNENCLNNFLKNFGLSEDDTLTIIADNIGENTEKWLQGLKINFIKTSLGNSGSFDFAYQHALENSSNDSIIYFVENDYLHRVGARNALIEGFNVFSADYVSLYDTPEKYRAHFNVNYSKFINVNEIGPQLCEVFYGVNNYFKTINTTTMTFAAKRICLEEDQYVFKSALLRLTENNHPYRKIPGDYELFATLTDVKKRKMVCPIPGYATHGDMLSPSIKWEDHL